MKKLWIFLVNTFEVNTRYSKKKMLLLANDHDARLDAAKDDPEILALYTPFHVALLVFQTLMAQFVSSMGIGKGDTKSWTVLLDEMAYEWFDSWEADVRQVFPKRSPQYLAIFPNGKAPFQSIKYDERLIAVEALAITLSGYTQLRDLNTEVTDKLRLLKEARRQQTGQFGKTGLSSSRLEEQRLVLADLMDDNLCMLKKKYRRNVKMVEHFFDLSLLRSNVSDDDMTFRFTGMVNAGTTSAVMLPKTLMLTPQALCSFTNVSAEGALEFFFSVSAGATGSPVSTTVLPSDTTEGEAAESGWAPGCDYLIVKNAGALTAEFQLMLTEAVPEAVLS